MGRSVRSCSVVLPGPAPRETQPRKRRPELDCPWAWASAMPPAAAASPALNIPRREEEGVSFIALLFGGVRGGGAENVGQGLGGTDVEMEPDIENAVELSGLA